MEDLPKATNHERGLGIMDERVQLNFFREKEGTTCCPGMIVVMLDKSRVLKKNVEGCV